MFRLNMAAPISVITANFIIPRNALKSIATDEPLPCGTQSKTVSDSSWPVGDQLIGCAQTGFRIGAALFTRLPFGGGSSGLNQLVGKPELDQRLPRHAESARFTVE